METNKMLREEKDKMEQELQQTQAKVSVAFIEKCSVQLDVYSIIYSILPN